MAPAGKQANAQQSRGFVLLAVLLIMHRVVGAEENSVAADGRSLKGSKPATAFPANVHRCVHASAKLYKSTQAGNPCMQCDPSSNQCNPGCQLLIDAQYHLCDKMCLPDGYFFDAAWTLPGCFADNKAQIKVAVERCGCNSGFRSGGGFTLCAILIVLLSTILFLM